MGLSDLILYHHLQSLPLSVPRPGPSRGMVRKLKFHEQRLLKKVDFYSWSKQDNLREAHVIRRYQIQKREDYVLYSKLLGGITRMANELLLLPEDDPLRRTRSKDLIDKLYQYGIIPTVQVPLSHLAKTLTVSAICRRRLTVMLVKMKMCETLKESATLIEQGHIRIGPETVTDPALLVTRGAEELIQWADRSKIRRKIAKYNNALDDYDLLN